MRVEADCHCEAFESSDAAFLLAHFLFSEAGLEAVRTREALAAAIANQVKQMQIERAAANCPPAKRPAAGLFVEALNRYGRVPAKRRLPAEEAVFASCLRIAKRAVTGALQDPTGGAIRFHRLGADPIPVHEQNPGLLIGPFLFYGDTSHASPATPSRDDICGRLPH